VDQHVARRRGEGDADNADDDQQHAGYPQDDAEDAASLRPYLPRFDPDDGSVVGW
jgi:hypothetical protein